MSVRQPLYYIRNSLQAVIVLLRFVMEQKSGGLHEVADVYA